MGLIRESNSFMSLDQKAVILAICTNYYLISKSFKELLSYRRKIVCLHVGKINVAHEAYTEDSYIESFGPAGKHGIRNKPDVYDQNIESRPITHIYCFTNLDGICALV